MSDKTKLFKVSGKITKPNFRTNFSKEVKALQPKDAVEEIYKILGSKHKVKRFYIKVEKVEEISSEESINT